MFKNADAIKKYLAKLDIAPEITDMYLALSTYGPQSISELARLSGVERTLIYRLMDEITASGLIEVEVRYKRSIFRAAPVGNLEVLLAKKEQDVLDLRAEFSDLERHLTYNTLESPVTRIQTYQGPEGLKQMLWNQTKSKTESLAFLNENMQSRTNEVFFTRWAEACNKRELIFRSLVNDTFLSTQKKWYKNHDHARLEKWEGRYIDDEHFPIRYSTVIYDDVTAYYKWDGGDIFGIELYNKEIADTQRRFFDMLWEQGAPLKI